MRQGKLGLWLAVAFALVSTFSAASLAGRWDVTVHLAPAGIELAASSAHARVALKL